MRRIVVACDGVRVPHRLAETGSSPLLLSSNNSAGAPNIRIPSLSVKLRGAVPNAALDLLRIAAFVYWADQMVSRPVNTDVSGEHWKRTFVMLVPVLEPDLWRRPEVFGALHSVLNYGTDDEWIFHFEQGREPLGQGFLFDADPTLSGDPGSVLLFSGGTDSLCAAIEDAAAGRRPLLISHSPSPRSEGQQRKLRDALAGASLGWSFPRYAVEVSKRAIAEKERTQRSRGFLYSSIGASVAAGFGLQDVVVADNGFVSVALPLNGQTVGAKMSRTTHPRFQYLFNRLLALALPGVRIRNPLLFRTRAEALQVLTLHGLEKTLRDTYSCAAGGRLPSAASHCGTCSQCLDRRIAVIAAGMQALDVNYQTNVFLDELEGADLMLAESYVRLMRKVGNLTSPALLEEFVELTDCASHDVDGEPQAVERIVEMVRRQAETALEAIVEAGEPVKADLYSGKFPTTCMVRLALAGSPVRKRKDWTPPIPPEIRLTAEEEQQFRNERFASRLPIVLTGKAERRTSTLVEIAGQHVVLADAELILLLRLIVALYESRDGFCRKGGGKLPGGIVDEPGIVPGQVDQAIGRLRQVVQPALGDLDPLRFVEVSRGRVRLSTHRSYIEVRRAELKAHPNDVVRNLVARIPAI